MQAITFPYRKNPVALRMMKILLIVPFFIYLPISFFRVDAFLFILDVALTIGMVVTITDPQKTPWIFGGKRTVLFFVALYIAAIAIRTLLDITALSVAMLTSLRNILFGMQVLIVSSAWINTQRRVDMVMKILVLGAFFTALWGIRQLVFGFLDFELERLNKMGASLREMEFMGRKRISSTFGDPLTFSFFLMIGVLAYTYVRKRKQLLWLTKTLHPWSILIIFAALVLTLTRAPLLGLMVGATTYTLLSLRITKRLLIIFGCVIVGVALMVVGLNWLVESRILADSDSDGLRAIHGGLESFWTLFQLAKGDEIDPQMYFLVNQSKDARSNAWGEGVNFLLTHPQGAGFSGETVFDFAITDVGILREGLELGVLGIISIIGVFIAIGLCAFADCTRIPDFEVRKRGYFFIASWVAIFVVCGISSIIETSVIAIVIWSIGGIMLNLKKIYNSELKEKYFSADTF